MEDFLYKDETYKIIGACFEVYNHLGKGFNEIVYKDALEIEFQLCKIPYNRETGFPVEYKSYRLSHYYNCNFLIYEKIILEIKAIECLSSGNLKQTMNYIAASKLNLGLLVNFGEDSLKYKRVILSKKSV